MNSNCVLQKQVNEICYKVEVRTIEEDQVCYDLILEGKGTSCSFPDVVRTLDQAERIFTVFTDMQVQLFEARYIVEDLLSDPNFLF